MKCQVYYRKSLSLPEAKTVLVETYKAAMAAKEA